MPPAFSIETARQRAEETLRVPPALARLARPVPRGSLVASWVLPIELLKPQNWARHRPVGVLAKLKDQLYRLMWAQQPYRPEAPLSGRPQVICTRFSSTEPDAYSNTFKAAVDLLCVPDSKRRKRGLGFIVDDKPQFLEEIQRWEPAPPGRGQGLIDLYDGQQRRNS
jgi:hypothetical protein